MSIVSYRYFVYQGTQSKKLSYHIKQYHIIATLHWPTDVTQPIWSNKTDIAYCNVQVHEWFDVMWCNVIHALWYQMMNIKQSASCHIQHSLFIADCIHVSWWWWVWWCWLVIVIVIVSNDTYCILGLRWEFEYGVGSDNNIECLLVSFHSLSCFPPSTSYNDSDRHFTS